MALLYDSVNVVCGGVDDSFSICWSNSDSSEVPNCVRLFLQILWLRDDDAERFVGFFGKNLLGLCMVNCGKLEQISASTRNE